MTETASESREDGTIQRHDSNDAQSEDTQESSSMAQNTSQTSTAESQPATAGSYNMSKWGMIKAFLFRIIITYVIFNFFRKPQQPQQNNKSAGGNTAAYGPSTNIFMKGEVIDLLVYINGDAKHSNFTDDGIAKWSVEGLKYGDWEGGPNKDGSYIFEKTFATPESLLKNGSLYMHAYVVKSGFSPDPSDLNSRYSQKYVLYKSKKLTRHKRRMLHRTANLLTGETGAHKDLVHNKSLHGDVKFLPACTHWHPNMTLNLIEDFTQWTQGSVPPPLNEYINFYPQTNEYFPIFFLNDYWNLHEEYFPVNETTPELTVRLTYSPMSLFKWQLYAAQSMRNNWYSQLMNMGSKLGSEGDKEEKDITTSMEEEHEQDVLKKTILDTNPYLLALTIVVSLVHMVFEMLAFKNDIQFWKSRESLEGLSVRSIFFNVFQSFVVVLYVLDNDSNFVIKMSVVVGFGIEMWKVFKVLLVKIDWQHRNSFGLPTIQLDYERSYVESDTKKYDQMAFRYLSWVLFPMLIGYCIYSLVYLEHRGWYSWVLSMLYGFLLTFGFITMTPQLFINYKMKSVAHLPWRMLTYKALNTFIDDLFAFIIRAPTLYRIGCLRDDVIFFIYLYQRWIYPIDPKRMNEFGVSKDMLDKKNDKELPEDSENKEQIEGKKEEDSSPTLAKEILNESDTQVKKRK